ncbi:unnamed protein product [Adineta steineri]|uniref:Uncharacterized protein n=1 Tax=Adineta steineri TaxID=433720 RepID=A0A818Z9A4_9BILA|nr:unnamed protein product [Adineta steineri]CAF3766404.1 unnamed protein product [Adineta steineri]CAF3823904.1 unnamed protein product [Adineta steineri]
MHLSSIFLLFCVSISAVSPYFWDNLKWPPWKSSDFTSTNGTCSYFVQHPDRAEMAIDKINKTLHITNEMAQIFASTINYLNIPDNQEKLTNSTSTCSTFFNEVKDGLVADMKNNNSTLQNAENKAEEIFNNFQDIFKNLFH